MGKNKKYRRWLAIAAGAAALAIGILVYWLAFMRSSTAVLRFARGYSLTYPRNWIVDTSRSSGPVDFIKEPTGKAMVAVQEMEDKRLIDPKTRGVVLAEAQGAFEMDKNYRLNSFEWMEKKPGGAIESYMAIGTFSKEGQGWLFREIAVFDPGGLIIFFRGNVKKEAAKDYGPIVDKIIFSFQAGLTN